MLLTLNGLQAIEKLNTTVLVSKIKFIINDEIFVWKEGEIIPDNPTIDGSQPLYISTFFKYKPGDEVTITKLEKEVVHSAYRLINSGLFYNPSVSIVPPRLYPDKRTIIIQVTDGFRMRFGGGEAFGHLGVINLGGNGHSVSGTAGLNINEVRYRNDTSLPGNFFWGMKLGYYNTLLNDYYSNLSHTSVLGGSLGYRFTPDLHLSIGLSMSYFIPGDRVENELILYSIEPLVEYKSFTKISENLNIKMGIKSALEITPLSGDVSLSIENTAFINSDIAEILGFKVKVSNGLRGRDNSGRIFNLYNDPSRAIRSGYSVKELHTAEYKLINTEIALKFPRAVIPPIFNIDTSLFIFNDLGLINKEIYDATGIGTAIYFDNPVFTGFVFTYGWTRTGNGRFLFTVTIEI